MIKLLTIPTKALKFASSQVSWGDIITDAKAVPHIIVELDADDSILNIVDGFHRASGFAEGPLTEVEVIACRAEDDEEDDLIAAAAVPEGFREMSQEDAIAEIRKRAGL